jgi:ribonuclease HI
MIESYTQILIVITAGPSVLTDWKGVSAAAWNVTLPGLDQFGLGRVGPGGVEVSAVAESNESEAALLALNAALRQAEKGEVRVFACQTWLIDGINGGVERWKAENWKDCANEELWQEYLRIRESKSVHVQGEHVAAADARFAGAFRILRKRARFARDERSKELGTPTAGFDDID